MPKTKEEKRLQKKAYNQSPEGKKAQKKVNGNIMEL